MDTPRESNWARACRASMRTETQSWTDNRAGCSSPDPNRRVMSASAEGNVNLETMASASGRNI
jgi:hypothetical protein